MNHHTNKWRACIIASVSTPEQAADEKQSLDTQETELRQIAANRNWHVAYVLRIPGFSRDFISWEECEREMLKADPPITAMSELRQLTEKHAYDVLMVRDPDRFGRTQSLVTQIAESICIRHGLRIYSQMDNQLVEGLQSRFWAAMVGIRVGNDQDKRKKYFQDGMNRRAEQGLPVSSQVFWSFRLVRDPLTGKADRLELDPAKKSITDAVAELILEGVSWMMLEQELFRRYGITTPEGRIYSHNFFYKRVYHPSWWGHNSRFFRNPRAPNKSRTDLWVFDEDEPLPEGVVIYRNVLPPVWEGELAERIKAELRRRRMAIRGSARSIMTRRFTGLVMCGQCGYICKYKFDKRRWIAVGCDSRFWTSDIRPDCDNRRAISEQKLREWLDARLRYIVDTGDWASLIPQQSGQDWDVQLAKHRQQIADTEDQIRILIMKQAKANAATSHLYDEQIDQLGTRLEYLKDAAVRSEQEVKQQEEARKRPALSYEKLKAVGVDAFWQWPEKDQNQLLHGLFGKYRLVLLDGDIIRISLVSPHIHQHRK